MPATAGSHPCRDRRHPCPALLGSRRLHPPHSSHPARSDGPSAGCRSPLSARPAMGTAEHALIHAKGGSKRPVPSRPLERADKDASGRSRSAPFRSRSQVPRESLVARTSWSCGPLSMIACQPLKARRDRERPAALDRAPVVLNRESAMIECAVATHAKQVVTTFRSNERMLSCRARSIRTGRRRCRFP